MGSDWAPPPNSGHGLMTRRDTEGRQLEGSTASLAAQVDPVSAPYSRGRSGRGSGCGCGPSQLSLGGHAPSLGPPSRPARPLRSVVHVEAGFADGPPEEGDGELASEGDVGDGVPRGGQHLDHQQHHHDTHMLFLRGKKHGGDCD